MRHDLQPVPTAGRSGAATASAQRRASAGCRCPATVLLRLQAAHGNVAVQRMVAASPRRLARSPFTVKGTQVDTVDFLPGELLDVLARMMRAGDQEGILSLQAALIADSQAPPEISGLSTLDVTLILRMVGQALDAFARGDYAPDDLPTDPNIYGPTVDGEPPGLFVLYRTMSASGVKRIVDSVAGLRGPGLGNRRREGKPRGENFYATSLDYAREYTSKGKRRTKGTVTLRFAFLPDVSAELLWNQKYARTHESTRGLPDTKAIRHARRDERGTVLIKDERIGKSKFRTSRNYGIRESDAPGSAEDPYTLFNRHIVSINIVPED
jgi:hypothetical protein